MDNGPEIVKVLTIGVLVLGLLVGLTLGLVWYGAYKRHKYWCLGVYVWTVDMGETERIAARTRREAIEWYLREYPEEWPREEIESAFDERATSLDLMHWKDVYQHENGKETLRASLKKHLRTGGRIPFLISTTCW